MDPKERLRRDEELAKVFFEVYRKTFVASSWDLTSLEFRAAVIAGVRAVVEAHRKMSEE